MAPKYDEIEKTASDVHSARDFDIKKLLKIKYAAPIGATFTSESSVDAKLDKLVGKIVAEKYKVKAIDGLTLDKATVQNDKVAGWTVDVESSYAVPSVDGLKILIDPSRKADKNLGLKIGFGYTQKAVLVNAKFDTTGKDAKKGTIWAAYSPLADLVLGTKVTTTADFGLNSAEAKASYSNSGVFFGATYAIKKEPPRPVKEGDKPAEPTPDSTVHLAFANDSGLKLAAKADILPSGSYGLVLGAEYLLKGALAQDVTLRIQGSDKGKVAGLFGLNLAKGVNLIANGDYDTQKAVTNVGLQLTLDA